MFNGTNDRLQNLNKLNYVYKYLQASKTHLKVLAIKGNNFEHEGFEYEFLSDHSGRVAFNPNFTSVSCLGQITRDQIQDLVSNPPDAQIELFSPIKMITAMDQKRRELAEAVKRNGELDESLQKAQKQYAGAVKIQEYYQARIETLEAERDRLLIVGNGYEVALQRARGQLLENYCVVDENNNIIEAKTDGWGWHFLSWLPFAGNIMLERKIQSEKRVAEIAKQIVADTTTTTTTTTSTTQQACSNNNGQARSNSGVQARNNNDAQPTRNSDALPIQCDSDAIDM